MLQMQELVCFRIFLSRSNKSRRIQKMLLVSYPPKNYPCVRARDRPPSKKMKQFYCSLDSGIHATFFMQTAILFIDNNDKLLPIPTSSRIENWLARAGDTTYQHISTTSKHRTKRRIRSAEIYTYPRSLLSPLIS